MKIVEKDYSNLKKNNIKLTSHENSRNWSKW